MLAVTTRNRLRSRRLSLPMLYASWQVRRQLAETPGIVRFATGISGLTEFFTLTVWESKTAMLQFTGSGSHRRMMWLFSRWSDSFWSMRWQLTHEEVGCWDGLALAPAVVTSDSNDEGPLWLLKSPVADELAPYIDVAGRPDKRDLNPAACGVTAVIALLRGRFSGHRFRLRRLMRSWRDSPVLLRSSLALTSEGFLLLSLWQAGEVDGPDPFMDALAAQFPRCWIMRFSAGNYEIGNWNGLRLRSLSRSSRGWATARQTGR